MHILAIETVGTTGSVALLIDSKLQGELPLNPQQRSAQSLVPGMEAMLQRQGWRPADVQLVAVAVGPGSFTGLRIGVATAKTFAYAVGCEVIGVPTLPAIATQAAGVAVADVLLDVVLDAGRGEVFAERFRIQAGQLTSVQPTRVLHISQWLEDLQPGQLVTGPMLQHLAPRLPSGVTAVDAGLWQPTAAAVGTLGWKLYESGQRDKVFDLVPHYHRRTAAEEQWERRTTSTE